MHEQDIDALWAAFKLKYRRIYANDAEEVRRFTVFTENVMDMDEDEVEITRFTDLSNEELAARIAQAQKARGAVDELPPAYDGPTASLLINQIARVELPNAGLILEVADSLVHDAGRGLFVRLMDGFGRCTVDVSTVFCGYAVGEMAERADSRSDTTVAFSLNTPETAVIFEGQIRTVRELLCAEGIERIAGHVAVCDQGSGTILRVEPDPLYEGPCYFIPSESQPSPLTFMSLGHMANDFAGGVQSRDSSYFERSKLVNILVPTQSLERDPSAPSTLRPLPPVLTLSRAITFANVAPMELGNEYGERYWERAPC